MKMLNYELSWSTEDGYSGNDLSTNTASVPIRVDNVTICAISLKWDGALEGTFRIQACNGDYARGKNLTPAQLTAEIDDDDWFNVPDAVLNITGDSGIYIFNLSDLGYTYLRVIWEAGNGAATVVSRVTIKS